jgi:hypothetical protein
VHFLAWTNLALACGPFTLSSVFVFTVHPAYPLEDFARGKVGSFNRVTHESYLVVAYRYLSGSGFNPEEQQKLSE